jgi:histidinol-phosphate phosphatase family protein
MNSGRLSFDRSWTLFLDRDGVINRRIPGGYVTQWDEFEFLPGVLEAIPILNSLFDLIIVVSNQQGVGKKVMTEEEVESVHQKMLTEVEKAGGTIHGVYFSPYLESENHFTRKPNPGMAYSAIQDFPSIDLKKSLMAGDSTSDLLFGRNAGMYTVYLGQVTDPSLDPGSLADFQYENLYSFAKSLLSH